MFRSFPRFKLVSTKLNTKTIDSFPFRTLKTMTLSSKPNVTLFSKFQLHQLNKPFAFTQVAFFSSEKDEKNLLTTIQEPVVEIDPQTFDLTKKVIGDTSDFIITTDSPTRTGLFPGAEPIDLINSIPPIEVESDVVSCDGGHGALGHPQVYISLRKPGPHPCGYCGLRFVRKAGSHHH